MCRTSAQPISDALALLKELRSVKDEATRTAMVRALDLLGDSRAATALARLVKDPSLSARLRGYAAEALGSCGYKSRVALQVLHAALADAEPEVRFFAAFAFGALAERYDIMAGPTTIDSLKRLLRDHSAVGKFGTVADDAEYALQTIRRAAKRRQS